MLSGEARRLRSARWCDVVLGAIADHLQPLTVLSGLRSPNFNAKRIDDGRIEPLAELTGLKELKFPANMFTTRQVAWLRSRLPDTVESRSLGPIVKFELRDEDTKDVVRVGKRKPQLSSVTDAARIGRHVDEFWQLVEAFRHDPALTRTDVFALPLRNQFHLVRIGISSIDQQPAVLPCEFQHSGTGRLHQLAASSQFVDRRLGKGEPLRTAPS